MTEPEAAVAIVRAQAPEPSILLMRRSERKDDSWSGHWSFPGGRRDPGDAGLLDTALRELAEECGIHLTPRNLEAELPRRFARRRAGAYVPVTPFLFSTDEELAAAPDGREAVEARWAPLRVLRDPSRHRLLPIPGMPPELRYPGVEMNGPSPLWGFTYRLISDWLGLSPVQESLEQAGFRAACMVLEFLQSRGLEVKRAWFERPGTGGAAAEVAGSIPVDAVLERFSEPGEHVREVNCLEVRRQRIRVAGLLFEEYFIDADAR